MSTEQIEAAARAIRDAVKISIRPNGGTMELLEQGHTFHLNQEEATKAAEAAHAAFEEAAECAANWTHQDCAADTGTSWVPEGRQYVIRCEWCPEVFYGPTKAAALGKFRDHEQAKLSGATRMGGAL